jgi:hypothetical protein
MLHQSVTSKFPTIRNRGPPHLRKQLPAEEPVHGGLKSSTSFKVRTSAMIKHDLQVVPGTENPATDIPDPFAPENLRLDQSFSETVSVKKLLTTIPVRKPSRQVFFRVHPSPEYREMFPIIDLKDDREEFIVHKAVLPDLATEVVHKQASIARMRSSLISSQCFRKIPSIDTSIGVPWWSKAVQSAAAPKFGSDWR